MVVNFYGLDSAGSIAKRNSRGGETAGSVSKRNILYETTGSVGVYSKPESEELEKYKVYFKGHDDSKNTSFVTKALIFAGATALIIGGLGYAHKSGWINKLGDGKIKDWSNKIAEPCHKWCGSVKKFCVDNWNKVADKFRKK